MSEGELREAALSGWAAQAPIKALEWLDAKALADYEASGKKLEEGTTVPIKAKHAVGLVLGGQKTGGR